MRRRHDGTGRMRAQVQALYQSECVDHTDCLRLWFRCNGWCHRQQPRKVQPKYNVQRFAPVSHAAGSVAVWQSGSVAVWQPGGVAI